MGKSIRAARAWASYCTRRSRRDKDNSDAPAAADELLARVFPGAGETESVFSEGARQGNESLARGAGFTGTGSVVAAGGATCVGVMGSAGRLEMRVPGTPRASSFSDWSKRFSSDATWLSSALVVSRCPRIVDRSCSFSAWQVASWLLPPAQPERAVAVNIATAKKKVSRMIRLLSNHLCPHAEREDFSYIPNMLMKTSISPVLTLLVPLNDHMFSITSTIIMPDRASMPATVPRARTFHT